MPASTVPLACFQYSYQLTVNVIKMCKHHKQFLCTVTAMRLRHCESLNEFNAAFTYPAPAQVPGRVGTVSLMYAGMTVMHVF